MADMPLEDLSALIQAGLLADGVEGSVKLTRVNRTKAGGIRWLRMDNQVMKQLVEKDLQVQIGAHGVIQLHDMKNSGRVRVLEQEMAEIEEKICKSESQREKLCERLQQVQSSLMLSNEMADLFGEGAKHATGVEVNSSQEAEEAPGLVFRDLSRI